MPFTLNGIGTTYYGKRDCTADASYITTEWIVFLYLPILPLGSYRVRPTGQGENLIFYYSTKYAVEKVSLCWPQVRNGYFVTGPIVGILGVSLVGPAIASIFLPSLIILILLLYAIAFFLFLMRNKSSPISSRSSPGNRSQPSPIPHHPLYGKILGMLSGDFETADRLLALARRQHPLQSNQWHHEKVIEDLIRDRQ